MIKNSITRRLIVATLTLFVLLIVYYFPKKDSMVNSSDINYVDVVKDPIFLIDDNDYVARTSIPSSSDDKVKGIIESLTVGSSKKDYIPNGFKAIIPSGTKIINYSIEDGLLKIDFSKELLNIDVKKEEKMIEAIIYSLTELDNVDKIMIFVEGNNLIELPNSKKKLPLVLSRNYGINKVTDIDRVNNSTKTTVYYIAKNDNGYYNVPVTYINNRNDEKLEIVIEELKSNRFSEPNLVSYLTASSELEEYEILENEVHLSFNNYLLDDLYNDDILEEVKYSIVLAIKDNYGVSNVSFRVGDNNI